MSFETVGGQMVDKGNKVVETPPSRAPPSKKNHSKVPKRIHKAEREKIKREHLNELFLALANALEMTEPNSGRASVLGEAIRIVKDMAAQIQCLRKENAALLSESHYVTTEKNELQDENSTLQTQIEQLQTEIKERVSPSKFDLNVAPSECQDQDSTSQSNDDPLALSVTGQALQHTQIMNPMYVIPFQPRSPVNADLHARQLSSKPPSAVRKPHPRYPTSDGAWLFRSLDKQPELGKAGGNSS